MMARYAHAAFVVVAFCLPAIAVGGALPDAGDHRPLSIIWLETPPDPAYGDAHHFRYQLQPPIEGMQFRARINSISLPDSVPGVSDSLGIGNMTLLVSNPEHHLIVGFPNQLLLWARDCQGISHSWLILHPAAVGLDRDRRQPEEAAQSPIHVQLWPNPCSSQLLVRVAPRPGRGTRLHVLDAAGRAVRTLDQGRPRGQEVHWTWDITDEPAGVYTILIRGDRICSAVRAVILR